MRSEIANHKFGRLTAIRRVRKGPSRSGWIWFCVCECGGSKEVLVAHLRNGAVKSCGCLIVENAQGLFTTHGATGTPEHGIWKALVRRCHNPNVKDYPNYGGRGITVFADWMGDGGFQKFTSYMGARPSPRHSIDRYPNPNGNYAPGNVRWATPKEQAANTRFQLSKRIRLREIGL